MEKFFHVYYYHDKLTFFDLKVTIDTNGRRRYNTGFTFLGTFSMIVFLFIHVRQVVGVVVV